LSRAVIAVAEKDLATIFDLVDQVQKTGRDLRQFTKDLASRVRDLLLIDAKTKPGIHHSESDLEQLTREAGMLSTSFLIDALKALTEAETEMRWNASPRLVLETCMLSLANKSTAPSVPLRPPKTSPAPVRPSTSSAAATPVRTVPPVAPEPAQGNSPVPAVEPAAPATKASGPAARQVMAEEPREMRIDPDAARKAWAAVIECAKKERPTVGALLHQVKPGPVTDGTLALVFEYKAHTELMYRPENRDVLERALAASLGQPVKIRFEVAGTAKQAPPGPAEDPLVKSVLEVFGGEIIPDEKPQR